MRSIFRIIVILFLALIFGLIYNQLHPSGIKWQLLLPPSIITAEIDIPIISADSAFVLMQDKHVVFIDSRNSQDYNLDHIVAAQNLSIPQLLTRKIPPQLFETDIWILYDNQGGNEELRIAANSLKRSGIKNIFILFGGYISWLENNYPTELGENY